VLKSVRLQPSGRMRPSWRFCADQFRFFL